MRLAAWAAGLALATSTGSLPALAQEGPEAPVLGPFDAVEEKRSDELGSFFCAELAQEAGRLAQEAGRLAQEAGRLAQEAGRLDVTAALAESLPAGTGTEQLLDACVLSVEGLETEVSEETAVTANARVEIMIVLGIEQGAAARCR